MRHSIFLLLLLSISVRFVSAQNGIIKGRVYDELTNGAIPFANVAVQNSDKGAVTDIGGKFTIENLETGLYNVQSFGRYTSAK